MNHSSRQIVTRWFIRLLGLVHFFNFINLLEQVRRCIGKYGLIPAKEYVDLIWKTDELSFFDKLVECPSIFLWFQGDFFLISGAVIGVLLSVLIMAGYHSRLMLLTSFLLYVSYLSVGGELYSFQWDSLILETTFLALLLPSSKKFFPDSQFNPDRVTVWLFYWLLFRIYLESGVAKLFWGPESWSTLEGLKHYYETAPIPTLFGYYAHFLPEAWHEFETGATLVIEILFSALIFGGKWPRRIAFVVFTLFQLTILLTANYGIFNYNTLILHLFLLTDAEIISVTKRLPYMKKIIKSHSPHPAKISIRKYAVAAVIIIFSIIEFVMFVGGRGVSGTVLADIHKYTGATRISSRYHLFGPIDPIRYEMVFEGSTNGEQWEMFEFPFKADNLFSAPKLIAPYHPRVDFRLWFERYPVRWQEGEEPYPDISIHPSVLSPYMGKLALQLLSDKELAMRHFKNDPFEGQKINELRIIYYHYNMVLDKEHDGKKQYWTRSLYGTVYIDTHLGEDGSAQMVVGRTTNQ